MIDAARTARLSEHLFGGGDAIYALLDAARDPRVYAAVQACSLPYECLYDGELPPELAAVAPYLVRLRPQHIFTERLLVEGWGQSWGLYLAAPGALPDLRRHLRRFLRVQTEAKKTLLFRYYDPRVLRIYLPTCSPDELTSFYGPITRFVMESEDGSALGFERHGEALSFTRVELG
jgi:hypothetical protein